MNRIFGIFVTFLLIPTLPTFGAMDEYEKCELNAGMKAFREWGFSEIPAEYQDKIDKIINSPVEQESSGTCTPGGNYHCNKGDIFKDCCPCAQFDAEMQVEKIFKQDYIKKECGHIKKQNLQETQATNNHPDNNFDFAAASATQNTSSGLLLATPAQEDKPQPDQRQQAVEANLKKATTVPAKPTKNKIDQSPNEQARLTRTALTKFCQDDGFVYKNNGTEIASLGYVKDLCDSKNKVELYCYNFKGDPIPSEDIIRHFANYCYTNTANSCESKKESRPSDHYNKKEAERAIKQEENKVGKRCEIENATSAKYTQVNGRVVCQPTKCKCGYELSNNKCNAWTVTQEQCSANNAKTAKYICENDKKVCKVEKCLDTHYLDSDKNKCIAKSTVKCTQYEEVDDTGKCISKHDADRIKAERQASCNGTNGEWTDDDKCKCKKGYKPVKDDPYACEPTDKTATNEENKKLCEKDGTGTWTDKNKCECTDPTHSFVDGKGCEKDDKKAEHEKHKQLCTSPNTWNDKRHKCDCKNPQEFFDEETGCSETTAAFKNNKEHLDNLNAGLEIILKELADGQQK